MRRYQYDRYGNRIQMEDGRKSTRYHYNELNQLTYKVDQNQNSQQEGRYAYGRRGNLTEIYRNGQLVNRYQFGALNRLEAAMDYQNNIGAVYQYNGLGHRIGKTEGICKEPMLPSVRLDSMDLNPTRRIEDVLDLTKQYHNLLQRTEGETKNCYTWDHNVLTATGTDGTSQSYIQDELGSPIRLMDEAGKVQQSYGYDEFGNDLYHSQSEIQPFGYTGYQRDGVARTYYAQAREYRPEMGRFISEDPVKHKYNWYIYCTNSPINRIDPVGLKDYIYTSKNKYYVENDWGFWEFLNSDRYYAEIDGNRYDANSEETVTLYDWNAVDSDFLDKTLYSLVEQANKKKTDFDRVMAESVGGELDFKLQMSQEQLYLANGVLYNRNEAGNFVWTYFLKSHGYGGIISGALAQGGSLLGSHRFDEPWDEAARKAGIKYYNDRKKREEECD